MRCLLSLASRRSSALFVPLVLAMALGACAEDAAPPDDGGSGGQPGVTTPPTGDSEFISADGREGQDAGESNEADTDAGMAEEDGGAERTVEEGDIYRVLADGLLLNLNSYRGLQVIDLNDPADPEVIGRAQISGYPVEMYVVGERAYILMNNWRGYYGWDDGVDSLADDVRVEQRYGGVVAVADISDPAAPRLLRHEFVPGNISTSRLTREGDAAALYVAAAGYGHFEDEAGEMVWETRTYVRSFDLQGGGLEPVSEQNLGGYVSDIQATPNALLVARWDWNWQSEERGSELSLFDISDAGGVMVAGDDIRVSGQIENKFNMDLRDGILRVVSANSWRSEANTNFVQTFDATDLGNVTPIDEATFGDNEDLYATLFLENSAFFVTYRRVDPFHAFEIRDDGTLFERSEFIVSGWNDYFRPVFDQTRLIGIGVNDENSRTMAVSLYDITDLDNAEPLITRSEVDASRSWSEASWDDRAFSVLEDAVEVYADDGTLETGLVLLPYTGYDSDWSDYTAAVQIFTFSDTTLTRRGLMEHGTPVRRSFPAHDTTANLSEAALSLFDTAEPDAPVELGRVELAPDYTDYFVFGDYGVRIRNRSQDYYWIGDRTALPPTLVEVVDGDAHPDEAETLATVELPASANLFQVGDLLVAMTRTVTSWDEYPYETDTELLVVDLSDPSAPRTAGSLTTSELPWGDSYYGWGWEGDCWDCGWGGYWGYGTNGTQALENGLVIPVQRHQSEVVGTEYTCRTYPTESTYCWGDDGTWREDCVTYSGSIRCTSLDGGPSVCTGDIRECTYDDGGRYDCEVIDADTVDTDTDCYENERYRYWSEMDYHFVDLRDADAPTVGRTVSLDEGEEFVSTLVDGDTVYASYREPIGVGDDGRAYVRYFIQGFDAANPSEVAALSPVNVPGELLAIDGDQLYTRDFVYGEEIIESSLARLTLYDGRAYLQARYGFPNQRVGAMLVDGDDRLFVSHQRTYSWWYGDESDEDWSAKLTVLDLSDGGLDAASTVTVDDWATLQAAEDGRALFQIPGGLLVVDADDVSAPFAAAWYPTRGWPRAFTLVNDDVVFAAGRYGLYRLPFDAYNLLPPL